MAALYKLLCFEISLRHVECFFCFRQRIRKHLLYFSLAAPVLTCLTYFGIGQKQKETLSSLNATGKYNMVKQYTEIGEENLFYFGFKHLYLVYSRVD